jgi:hypothetical protein
LCCVISYSHMLLNCAIFGESGRIVIEALCRGFETQ